MILEIVIAILAIILVTQVYIIWNLYTKCDRLEQWVDTTYVATQNTLSEAQRIDSLGYFEADDEVGVLFTQLKEIINNLENITEE